MDPLIGRFLKHAAMGLFTSYALFGHTVLAEPLMVSAGDGHSCVLLSTGTIQCWGYNGSGQLGDGTQTTRATPVQVKGISDAIAVSAGKGHLAPAKAALQAVGLTREGGDSEFYIRQMQASRTAARADGANSGACGNPDRSPRDELLAKISAKKDA